MGSLGGVIRHIRWQLRKVWDLFPYEQRISDSTIVAEHAACGVSALINSQGMYDYNNMHFLKNLLGPGDTFLDIGANIGPYALIASEQDEVVVLAFEPHPETYEYLSTNVERNGRSNVHLVNAAVAEKEGTLYLTNRPGSATNRVVAATDHGSIQIAAVRIDSVCARLGIVPRYAKLDVEGYEYEALKGLGDLLPKIDALFMEMKGHAAGDSAGDETKIRALMENAGLAGPFSLDFDARKIRRSFRNREDKVFLSSHLLEELKTQAYALG